MQFPAPVAQPLFANSTIIRESTEGDPTILQQLLQFHHAVVVLLYSHKNWRSTRAALAFNDAAEHFVSYSEIAWFAINCVGGCGSNIQPQVLPQLQYYENAPKRTDTFSPTVFYDDITLTDDIVQFVTRQIHPLRVISTTEEFDSFQTQRDPYESNGNIWISPKRVWFSDIDEVRSGLKELVRQTRIIRNELQIEASVLLFNQNETAKTHLELFIGFPKNYTVSSIFGKTTVTLLKRQMRHVSTFQNGGIVAARNNFVYNAIKPALKAGFLLFLINGRGRDLTNIDNAIDELKQCKNEEYCFVSNRCYGDTSISVKSMVEPPSGCMTLKSEFWRGDKYSLCCNEQPSDENILCKFNRTMSILSFPSHYEIISTRFDTSSPTEHLTLIDFKDEREVGLQLNGNRSISDFLQLHLSTNRFSEEVQFEEQHCESNSSYTCLPQLINAHRGFSIDEYFWQRGNINRIVLLIAEPCGTCEIATRLVIEAKSYLKNRLSPFMFARLSFVLINTSKARIPVQISFNRFPQIMIFPAGQESGGDSIVFSQKLTLLNFIGWLLKAVDIDTRLYLALELKGGSASNGILSAWNLQRDKLNAVKVKFQMEKYKNYQYREIIREQTEEIDKLERWKRQEEERKLKVAYYAGELARLVNSTKNGV